MRKVDTLVIGGGVAGLSTAYFLSRFGKRSILVLEQEKELGGHASGRNAGMLRQALPDPILARLAVDSRRDFRNAEKNGWPKLGLKRSGSLLLSHEDKEDELQRIEETLTGLNVRTKRLTRAQAVRTAPLIEDGDFTHALFCPDDGLVNIRALLKGFLRQLKDRGVTVKLGRSLESVRQADGGFLVRSGDESWYSDRLVNAAGAWAGWVADKAGASRIPLTAYRRHLFFSPQSPADKKRSGGWPFVWDLSHDFYFRPMDGQLLFSPCDKTLETRGDRSEKVHKRAQSQLKRKLADFSGHLSSLKITRAVSGLRTMTSDGRFVIGSDPQLKEFYWVAGLGGHGVTTCFSVGRLAAGLILGRPVEKTLKEALSPERFEVVHAS